MKPLDGYDFCAYHLREARQATKLEELKAMACSGKKKPKGKSGKGGGK